MDVDLDVDRDRSRAIPDPGPSWVLQGWEHTRMDRGRDRGTEQTADGTSPPQVGF